ncbi:MAG: type II toxin-antitoxin system HicA family toxin [Candidatus Aenigmarchaeota archaeon]|nr:type II toxin-antitoxin system HicA family toxin [Candidatus Aenigmarchaeota archaeon]
MSKLPVGLSGRDIIKVINKLSYEIDHQTGSHIVLRQKEYPHRRITVPNHHEIAKGTLRSIIRQLGLTKEEFLELL